MQVLATQGVLGHWGRLAKNLWQFSRPHAFLGSLLQFVIIVGFVDSVSPDLNYLTILSALLTILLVHIYGMGVNQLADLKIDRINKPELPLAAGSMSLMAGKLTTILSAVFGLGLALLHNKIFFATNFLLFLGLSLYSLPPLQWKRFPVLAALTIAVSRSFLLVGGYYLALSGITHPADMPKIVMIFIGFMFFYAIGIALAKDAPDIKGDLQFKIHTFASRVGVQGVVNLTLALQLMAVFLTALFSFNTYQDTAFRWIACIHLIGAGLLLQNYRRLRRNQVLNHEESGYPHQAIVSYYMNLWKILYFEMSIFLLFAYLAVR
ncbi:MAG: UbiA family prenyltransferase [Oligoflexus sp.]